jgi:peroxiredoxin
MTIKTGDKLPQANFMTFGENGPEPKSTDDIFSGKKVALFAVPGAFTPTCSAKHLPGFVEQADALKSAGVDEIACLSVNDVFVMGAWGEQQEVGSKVHMLADGNGDFTKDIGLELDGTGFGMGQRSQRYAMVVNDGVVEHLFVEAPGEFKVSSADHMLDALKG